jgi:uncharacterized protein YciI
MPFFAIYALDKPGMLELRTALRPSHRERLRHHDHPVIVHIGGPLLDNDAAMAGSLLVIEAADLSAVQAYLDQDPYIANGVFERVEIRPFAWGLNPPAEAVHG